MPNNLFLLSFFQLNTVGNAVYNTQPAWINEYIKPSNEEMWFHSLYKHFYIISFNYDGSSKVKFVTFHDNFLGLTNKYITIVSEYLSKSKKIKQISQLVQR